MRCLRFLTVLIGLAPGLLFAATQTFPVNVPILRAAGQFVRILVIKPDKPLATVILFAGGKGIVPIAGDGTTPNQNFLVRSRYLFAQHGLAVAVVNAPSDRYAPVDPTNTGMGDGFRRSPDHADDIAGVIAYMRKEVPGVPLWLVGTSRGSTSAAYVAMRKPPPPGGGGPDGIVLTSSIVVPVPPALVPIDKQGDSLLSVDSPLSLAQITVPTLVMHHIDDQCNVTPYAGVPPLLEALTGAPKLQGIPVRGGSTPSGNPCEALHYHGFIGIEGAVVARMALWIKFGFKEKP